MKARQREYETVYLLRADLSDGEISDARQRIEDAVEEAGGHVLKTDDWGVRDLAYEVKDDDSGRTFERGQYQYIRYMVPSSAASVAEEQLKFVEPTLKYLTVKVDDDLIPEERLEEPVEKGEGSTLPYESE